jgi:hypothetical protein
MPLELQADFFQLPIYNTEIPVLQYFGVRTIILPIVIVQDRRHK